MKKEELDKKYREILEEVRKGKSLTQIAKERKTCRRNLGNVLKKRFPEEYDTLIYGIKIGWYNGYTLRKIPNNQTNRVECDITKRAKKILKKKYFCVEEVGVWSKDFKKKYTVDLYNPRTKLGIELCWSKSLTSKKLIKRMKEYKKFCKDVLCVLIKDSSIKSRDRQYIGLPTRLNKAGIVVRIFDIGENTLT